MAALTQPTGLQLVTTYPEQAGTVGTIGTLDDAAINSYIAANPQINVVTTTTTYIRAIVASAGYDPDNLQPLEFAVAKAALHYACIYELLLLDFQNRQCIPMEMGGGIQADSYESKLMFAKQLVAQELLKLGIRQSRYWVFQSALIERINNCNHYHG